MSTFRGQFYVNIPAGSIFFLGSAIAAGSIISSPSKIGLDTLMVRAVVGSGIWTVDPNVGAGSFSASQGGLPFGGADVRLVVPADPRTFSVFAIGAMQVNGILFEGQLPNL